MASIPQVTSATFESQVLQSDVPVLVDLYAPWCGPCQMMAPVLEKIAGQVKGRARIVKVNTDEEPQLASAFGVTGVPTLALVHDRRVVDGRVGLTSAKEILDMIDKVAKSAAPAVK